MLLQLQNTILEMIATGRPLEETLDCLCREVESLVPRMVCSVVAVDHQKRLRPLAGPTLPHAYSSALDGIEIGPFAGSCGTAAYYQEAVSATDIDTDVRWRNFKTLVRPLGFKACWSSPILSADRVVGTFAFYYFDRRGPSELEKNIVGACVHLCSIAFERHERVKERQRLTYTDALTGLGNRLPPRVLHRGHRLHGGHGEPLDPTSTFSTLRPSAGGNRAGCHPRTRKFRAGCAAEQAQRRL